MINNKLLQLKLEKVFRDNSDHTNLMKSVEELQELSLVLTQYLNRKGKIEEDKVEEEIAHVFIRLTYLLDRFDKNNIEEHINKKITQIYKNVSNR